MAENDKRLENEERLENEQALENEERLEGQEGSESVYESVDLDWLLAELSKHYDDGIIGASGNGLSDDGPQDDSLAADTPAAGASAAGTPATGIPATIEKPYFGRPKARIPLFLERLGELWQECWPDWRFGQLMINLDRYYRAMHNDMDFFFLEEDKFEAFLEEYAEWTRQQRQARQHRAR